MVFIVLILTNLRIWCWHWVTAFTKVSISSSGCITLITSFHVYRVQCSCLWSSQHVSFAGRSADFCPLYFQFRLHHSDYFISSLQGTVLLSLEFTACVFCRTFCRLLPLVFPVQVASLWLLHFISTGYSALVFGVHSMCLLPDVLPTSAPCISSSGCITLITSFHLYRVQCSCLWSSQHVSFAGRSADFCPLYFQFRLHHSDYFISSLQGTVLLSLEFTACVFCRTFCRLLPLVFPVQVASLWLLHFISTGYSALVFGVHSMCLLPDVLPTSAPCISSSGCITLITSFHFYRVQCSCLWSSQHVSFAGRSADFCPLYFQFRLHHSDYFISSLQGTVLLSLEFTACVFCRTFCRLLPLVFRLCQLCPCFARRLCPCLISGLRNDFSSQRTPCLTVTRRMVW